MKRSITTAALITLSLACVCRADFSLSFTSEDIGGGLGRITYYALARPGSGSNQILASDLTLDDKSGHNFVIRFSSGTAKADLTGTAAPDPYHSDRSYINLLGDPSGGASGTDNDPTAYSVVSTTPANTHANYAGGVSQFEVVGANLSGGVDASSASNGGNGAIIAVAVVPLGDDICLMGSLGGATGGAQSIFCLPEPATIAILLPGLLAVSVRRRSRDILE